MDFYWKLTDESERMLGWYLVNFSTSCHDWFLLGLALWVVALLEAIVFLPSHPVPIELTHLHVEVYQSRMTFSLQSAKLLNLKVLQLASKWQTQDLRSLAVHRLNSNHSILQSTHPSRDRSHSIHHFLAFHWILLLCHNQSQKWYSRCLEAPEYV